MKCILKYMLTEQRSKTQSADEMKIIQLSDIVLVHMLLPKTIYFLGNTTIVKVVLF